TDSFTLKPNSLTNWCYHQGAKITQGDFNGDGKTDLLCHDGAGSYWPAWGGPNGFTAGPQWMAGFCAGKDNVLYVAGFNGDGRSDLLCNSRRTGAKTVALSNGAGAFTVGTSTVWCDAGIGATMSIGDFDGDGKADLFCHDRFGGFNNVVFSKGDGTFETRAAS